MPKTNDFDCPDGGFHFWMDLGTFGPINYQCDKCGIKVSSDSIPNLFGCNLNGYHHWGKNIQGRNLLLKT